MLVVDVSHSVLQVGWGCPGGLGGLRMAGFIAWHAEHTGSRKEGPAGTVRHKALARVATHR